MCQNKFKNRKSHYHKTVSVLKTSWFVWDEVVGEDGVNEPGLFG